MGVSIEYAQHKPGTMPGQVLGERLMLAESVRKKARR